MRVGSLQLRSVLFAAATLAILLAVNLIGDIGVGYYGPLERPCVDLERNFGWPAWYRVELWDSNDPAMFDRSLADFRWYNPDGKMALKTRRFGWGAAATNLFFALAAAIGIGTLAEGEARGKLGRFGTTLLVLVLGILTGLYFLADVVEVAL